MLVNFSVVVAMRKKNVAIILIILLALLLIAVVISVYNQKIAKIDKQYGEQTGKELLFRIRVPDDKLNHFAEA